MAPSRENDYQSNDNKERCGKHAASSGQPWQAQNNQRDVLNGSAWKADADAQKRTTANDKNNQRRSVGSQTRGQSTNQKTAYDTPFRQSVDQVRSQASYGSQNQRTPRGNQNYYAAQGSQRQRIPSNRTRQIDPSDKEYYRAVSYRGARESNIGPMPDEATGIVRKRKRRWKKPLIIVLTIVLVLVGSGVGYGLWYYNDLKNNLTYQGDTEELNAVLTEAKYTEPFYILVIGSDSWENYGARSDTMMLVRVDLNKPQATMVSVPRDTPYNLNGQTVKLNQVYAEQGEAACIEAVSRLTGVPIAHYVEVKFDQFHEVVDSLGGIIVDVPQTIDYEVYTKDQPIVHIDAGEQLLNGEQAVALARMRTAYSSDDEDMNQDAIRQANIRMMMIAMMKQIIKSSVNEIPGKIQQVSQMVVTDIPLDSLVDWAMKCASANEIKVYSCTGPTAGSIDDTTGLWLTKEAPESWAALMESVDAGENPKSVLSTSEDGSIKLEAAELIQNSQ